MNKSQKQYYILKYRLILNKRLYEDNIIDIDTYQKMENILIDKISKIKLG